MQFGFTEEQAMLRHATARLMEREITPALDAYSERNKMPGDEVKILIRKIASLGFLASTLKEERGGENLDWVTHGAMMEVLDSRIFGSIVIAAGVARMIAGSMNTYLHERYLPKLLTGDLVGCAGISEPDVGSATAMVRTTAVEDGDHYLLNGSKIWISNAPFADVATVLCTVDPAAGPKGLAVFLVDGVESPFEVSPIEMLGETVFDWTGQLTFDNCRVPKRNMIAAPGEGLKFQLNEFSAARCFVGMGSLLIAQECIEHSVAYAKLREQWGKPIGSFQLIQAMIADMIADTDAARMLIYRALWMLDQGARCVTESSIAKYRATDMAIDVASKAVEIHGGNGLSAEYPVASLYRRARMGTIPDGTNEIQRLIVGREVLGLSAF